MHELLGSFFVQKGHSYFWQGTETAVQVTLCTAELDSLSRKVQTLLGFSPDL